jgi:hypothetical protein
VRTPFTAATGGLRSEKERDTPDKTNYYYQFNRGIPRLD